MLGQYLANTHKATIRPRFTFKRRFKVVDGTEVFENIEVPTTNIDPTYIKWSQSQILDDLKQQILFASEEPLNNPNAIQQIRQKDFELPDGVILTIGQERAMIPETLFTQNSGIEGFTGLQTMTTEAISRTDIDIRRDLFASVIIAGGNCMLKNMEKRLERQVTDIAP